MSTLVNIDGRTLNITHISTVCTRPDHIFGASHPLMVVEPKDGGSNVIIIRPRYASGELKISSEAFIPDQFMDMVMKNVVAFNSAEGKRVYRLDASRC
jgi:hypothetical protein